MLSVQTVCLTLAGVIAIAFGLKYMLAREFMGYHATVAQRSWAELPSGVQAIVLGMYTIMGGGFITFGAALLWLLLPLNEGARWAAIAALTLTVTSLVPVVYVTLWLRRLQPQARTPVVPAVVVLVLAVVGAAAPLLR
jgi:hypothetical protein